MARVSKGVAVYCNAGELGNYVLESFVARPAFAQEHEE